MRNALRAAFAYFIVVFAAGFLLGTVRTLLVARAVGDLAAVAAELPIILTVSWIACGWAVLRFDVPASIAARIVMGACALALMMGGEVLVSTGLAGRTLTEHFALYETFPVRLGLLGQVAYAVLPLVRYRHRVGRE